MLYLPTYIVDSNKSNNNSDSKESKEYLITILINESLQGQNTDRI